MTPEQKEFVETAVEEIMYDVDCSNHHEIQPQVEYLVKIIREQEAEIKAGAGMLAKMHDNSFDLQKRITDLCAEIAALRERLRYVNEHLNTLKISHYTCEDGWYSCPKSGECLNEMNLNDGCFCNADRHNQKIDEIINAVKAAAKEEI